MNPLIQLRQTTVVFLIAFGLACFGLSPAVQAVSPAPDGGYPNQNTAEGDSALLSLSSGINNTAIGWKALQRNTTNSNNTAVGTGALFTNNGPSSTTATGNTATGSAALFDNRVAIYNTANGAFALYHNNSTGHSQPNGCWNSAFGASALFSNTDGAQNAAFGESAMYQNTTGNYNTAIGDNALRLNQTGSASTAVGYHALYSNTANDNTAVGAAALVSNTAGIENTAVGYGALAATNANFNTALGWHALTNSTTGLSNIALGAGAGNQLTSENFNIDIGHNGIAFESNTIRIGSLGTQNFCFIAGTTAPVSGQALQVGSGDQIGVAPSSRRFKQDIKPMEKASETIFALKPVSFRYKKAIDPDRIPQFGLVAEDVEKVNPDLVAHDRDGKPYTVRYDAVNAMLLNEFLKEHQKVEDLKKDFQATVAQLTTQLREQAAQIQKVSAQLEASKPAPQMVGNP